MAPGAAPLESESETEVADMSIAHTQVRPQTHTEETSEPELIDFLSEAPIFETDVISETSQKRGATPYSRTEKPSVNANTVFFLKKKTKLILIFFNLMYILKDRSTEVAGESRVITS